VSDFVTELRAEVVDAHAAHRRRRRAGRAIRTLRVGARPALAAAAALLVAVLALRAVAPPPPIGVPRVLDVIRVGGTPIDAVGAGGSVWVADSAGRRVLQLDVEGRQVAKRARVGGQPVAVTAGPGGGGLWVRTAVDDGGAVGRVGGAAAARVGFGTTLAAGPTTVWAADVELGPEGIHRIEAGTARDTGLVDIPGVYALATGGRALWAVTGNGTVLRLDGVTGRIRARWPAVAISAGSAPPVLAADSGGAWVLRTAQGADSQAIRLEGDRVARRLRIDPSVLPVMAQAADGLWVAAADSSRSRSSVVRLDPESGEVTARVDLGSRNVTALVAVRDELWVVAGDGTVTVVGD
jgi:hypothetical protein